MKPRTMLAGGAIVLLSAGVPACASSSDHGAGARAAASSLAADPTYQAQVQKLQNELLANFQKDFHPTHPITSMENAVRDTFPGAHVSTIVSYAVKTFSLKDRKRGPAQDAWMHGVVTFALAQGTQGVGTTQPSIPGVTSSPSKSPSPSPSHTVRSVPPSSASPVHLTVHPGAFCSQAGETGVTNTGHAEVCRTSATDSQLRWRSA